MGKQRSASNMKNIRKVSSMKQSVIFFTVILSIIPSTIGSNELDPYESFLVHPLAPYFMQSGLAGPLMRVAMDEKGQVEFTRIHYDEAGFISTEYFYDRESKLQSEIQYTFEKGQLVKIQEFDERRRLQSTVERIYRDGHLATVVKTGEGGYYTLHYSYFPKRTVVVMNDSSTAQTVIEHIAIEFDMTGKPTSVRVTDKDGKLVIAINYAYDENGRLRERVKLVLARTDTAWMPTNEGKLNPELKTFPAWTEQWIYVYDENSRLSGYIVGRSDRTERITVRLIYSGEM